METCVIFATANRPQLVGKIVEAAMAQSVKPLSVILSCVSEADADQFILRDKITLVTGEKGLTKQRNTALRHVPAEASFVAFFDDDFVPHPRWIEVVEETFRCNEDIVAITGNMIADGINGPGYTFEQAQQLIKEFQDSNIDWIQEPFSPYGCNMAFRKSAVKDNWFDERLVLYAWQEDRDFGARVAKHGRAVKVGAALGVHMGIKSGRVSGVRLGYSQIANPIYLCRKGTMTFIAAIEHMLGNFTSNLMRAAVPEPYIDRLGRLRGNLIAVLDMLRGRLTPERAEQL